MIAIAMTIKTPATTHREWRFLLRDFVSAHPGLQPVSSKFLQFGLAAVASVARWLALEQPDLLERDELTLLIPGASGVECADDGRWFSFLPWLLNRPGLKVNVYLVGTELSLNLGLSGSRAAIRGTATPAAAQVARYPKANLFSGTLGQWRKAAPNVSVNACVLFSPGFSSHHETWFAPGELVPSLSGDIPLGIFSYSKLDALEDQEVLKLLGFQFAVRELGPNPWVLEHDHLDAVGGFAYYPWSLERVVAPAEVNFDNPDLRDYLELQQVLREDAEQLGPDQAIERLVKSIPLRTANGNSPVDWLYVLPCDTGVLKLSGRVGYLDEDGFTPVEPPLQVPADVLATRPDESDVLACAMWALRLYRDRVSPLLDEHEENEDPDLASLFGDLSDDTMSQWFKQFSKKAVGKELDYGEFMNQMRASGGVHGPTHPSWFDLLSSLGWSPDEYLENPDRFEAAFSVPGPGRKMVPVVCEAYAYLPDDADDALANEALAELPSLYPDGVLLLFKSMPYQEVQGHKYSFGGMLYWSGKWAPFAMTQAMTSLGQVIAQIQSGFSFDAVLPQYADDHASIAIPFNRMCYGLDPNENGPIMGLKAGKWVTLMPSEA